MSLRIPAVAAVVCLVLAAGCSEPDRPELGQSDPPPPETVTTELDPAIAAAADLPPVAGRPTTTLPDPQAAAFVGTVVSSEGLVAGATVRFERFVDSEVERWDVVADGGGRFELRGVPGGRYRIRAYLPPSYAQTEPVVGFFAGRQEHQLELVATYHSEIQVRTAVAPQTPETGQPVNLVVAVGETAVDGEGVVQAAPAAGASVELFGLGRWQLAAGSGSVSVTDAAGTALFNLECVDVGPPALVARITSRAGSTPRDVALELPSCVEGTTATPTTTEPELDSSGTGGVDESPPETSGDVDDVPDDGGADATTSTSTSTTSTTTSTSSTPPTTATSDDGGSDEDEDEDEGGGGNGGG